jgi:hypothetical protein
MIIYSLFDFVEQNYILSKIAIFRRDNQPNEPSTIPLTITVYVPAALSSVLYIRRHTAFWIAYFTVRAFAYINPAIILTNFGVTPTLTLPAAI